MLFWTLSYSFSWDLDGLGTCGSSCLWASLTALWAAFSRALVMAASTSAWSCLVSKLKPTLVIAFPRVSFRLAIASLVNLNDSILTFLMLSIRALESILTFLIFNVSLISLLVISIGTFFNSSAICFLSPSILGVKEIGIGLFSPSAATICSRIEATWFSSRTL